MDLLDTRPVLEVIRSDRITIRGVEGTIVDHEVRQALAASFEDRFNRENPAYLDARRFRRPCRHIDRRIELFGRDRTTGDWFLPRGAERDVMAILDSTVPGMRVETIDRTVSAGGHGLVLHADLRDYQHRAVCAAIAAGQGVIQAPTGSGKTVMACGLISATGMNTLLIVHTTVLLEQTVEAVRRFLGVEPGVVGAGQDDVRPVTVAMVQTLVRRNPVQLHDVFGMVVLDEAHHCPAESFKSVLARFPARFRFGLTATPSRKDRLHPVLYDVIGPIATRVDARALMAGGSITPVEVVRVDTGFSTRYTKDYGRLVTRISRNKARNELVADAVRRHMGERTLVLSERVEHCAVLSQLLAGMGVASAVMTGALSREDRASLLADFQAGSLKILISTSSLVGEGFDLPALDTVVITIPNGNTARTTQFLGRALRPSAGKKNGRIVDFCDGQVSLLLNQYNRRAAVYRKFAVREISESWPPGFVE